MLAKSDINSIEAKVNTILENVYGSTMNIQLPVSLQDIMNKYEITAQIGTFEDPDISGVYEKEKKIIYVASDEAANRKSFTIGHELGHFFLHQDKKDDIFYRSQILNLTDEEKQEEQEANWFAATLLMPENQLQHFYSLTKDMGELAVVFGVSSTAVYYRLKNLDLLA